MRSSPSAWVVRTPTFSPDSRSSTRGDDAQLLHQVEKVVAQPVLPDQPALGSPDVVAMKANPCTGRCGAARNAALIGAFGDPPTRHRLPVHDRPHLNGEV